MMDELTGFQRDVLYVIAGFDDKSPPYGLAIKDELERGYSNEVNHGRLYPVLNQLAERGFVEKGSVDKQTNSYGLTERGHQAIEARREWEDQYVSPET
jgi:PadR family transcriptional regulator PadR